MKKRSYTKEESDIICQKFTDNPKVNPETGKRLITGAGPYRAYVEFCEQHKINTSTPTKSVTPIVKPGYESTTSVSTKSVTPIVRLSYEPATTSISTKSVTPIVRPSYEPTTTSISTKSVMPIVGANKELSQIKVGDVGTYTRGGRYGRQYWDGFTVTKIIVPDKKIEVEFDEPILVGKEEMTQIDNPDGYGWIYFIPEENRIRILEYRRPGHWMFKGVPAKDMFGEISIGEKRTEIEEGMF